MRNGSFAAGLARLAIPLLAMVTACERVVDVRLPEGERYLVVEGRIEKVQGKASVVQRVRLTTTDAYFSDSAPPPALGASVRVIDDAGRTLAFTPSPTEPGVYESLPFAAELRRRYTVQIDWEGDRYEGSDTLDAVAPIDSLYFLERNTPVGPREGLRATIDTFDPPGVRNYYLWDQLVDGVRLIAPDSSFRIRVIANDDLVEGQRVREYQPYSGIPVSAGQLVTVRQIALSETAYRYYLALSDQVSNDGSPFSVAPASVRGNVANRTRPGHRALGYFMAGEVAEATRRVPQP